MRSTSLRLQVTLSVLQAASIRILTLSSAASVAVLADASAFCATRSCTRRAMSRRSAKTSSCCEERKFCLTHKMCHARSSTRLAMSHRTASMSSHTRPQKEKPNERQAAVFHFQWGSCNRRYMSRRSASTSFCGSEGAAWSEEGQWHMRHSTKCTGA